MVAAVVSTVAIASSVVTGPPAGGALLASSARVAAVSSTVQLNGVSCVTATACFAVGEGSSGRALAAVTTLTERWNGHFWTIVPSPNPNGARNSHLDVVSCTSAQNCLAVGASAATGSSRTALVERWNGKIWTIVPAPNPTDTFLEGLSCTTATFCIAVGLQGFNTEGSATHTLAERWNGKRWSIVPSSNPHASVLALDAVSCSSSTDCSAVGDYADPGLPSSSTLVEHWNGKTWKIVASPGDGSGAEFFGLVGVSCPSATSCVSVGEIGTGLDAFSTLAERWNGRTWSLTPSPTGGNLYSVSCASATNCFAAGSLDPLQGDPASTLVDRWNGTHWSEEATPSSNDSFDVLATVSCASSTYCLAVGESDSVLHNGAAALAEQWNGTNWSIVASP
jgi:hypothetical protein